MLWIPISYRLRPLPLPPSFQLVGDINNSRNQRWPSFTLRTLPSSISLAVWAISFFCPRFSLMIVHWSFILASLMFIVLKIYLDFYFSPWLMWFSFSLHFENLSSPKTLLSLVQVGKKPYLYLFTEIIPPGNDQWRLVSPGSLLPVGLKTADQELGDWCSTPGLALATHLSLRIQIFQWDLMRWSLGFFLKSQLCQSVPLNCWVLVSPARWTYICNIALACMSYLCHLLITTFYIHLYWSEGQVVTCSYW